MMNFDVPYNDILDFWFDGLDQGDGSPAAPLWMHVFASNSVLVCRRRWSGNWWPGSAIPAPGWH